MTLARAVLVRGGREVHTRHPERVSVAVQRGRAPKLNVLEVRSLGGRHAIYVVGDERERLLLASGPTGVSFLSPLPPADDSPANETTPPPSAPSFAQALTKVLRGK